MNLSKLVVVVLICSLCLWKVISLANDVKTDITDCSRLEIRSSRKHPALNGFYDRSNDYYNGLPTFEGTQNGKTRYIWWNPQKQFTRWSIGIDKYSNSIEAFMDNRIQQAWLQGQGRSWHVVHEGEWVIDEDMFVSCISQENQKNNNLQAPDMSRLNPDSRQNNNNNDNDNTQQLNANSAGSGGGGGGGGTPPVGRTGGGSAPGGNNNNNNVAQTISIQVKGSTNPINTQFFKHSQNHDGFDAYKSQDNLYIYHFTYDTFSRWYIGNELGTDSNVYAFIYSNKNDLITDSNEQIWTEHFPTTNQWTQNPNIKLTQIISNNNNNNNNIDNNIRKPPPLTRQNAVRDVGNDMDSDSADEPPETIIIDDNNDNNFDGSNDDRIPAQQQRNRRQQKKQQENIEQREQRKKDMFRKVNNIDRVVSERSNMESGVSTSNEPSIVLVGSDDEMLNNIYVVQPLKYNDHRVYKSALGSYLYYVFYEDIDTGRWQIGRPTAGMQNDQPIAFVNSNVDKPQDIPTWQAWLVFDFNSKEWLRQVNINTYNSDCVVTISGGWNENINGKYDITPQTYNNRPVFEKLYQDGSNGVTYRLVIFMDEKESSYPRWYISQPDGNIGDTNNVQALIQSSALTIDGASDYEIWQEFSNVDRIWNENTQLKVGGTCSKVKEHDWKTKRKRRREEKKRRKEARQAQQQNQCPGDMTVNNDPGESFATVHWNPVGVVSDQTDSGDDDDFDAIFDDEALSPGSQFALGRTNVVYSIRRKSDNSVIANCDFVIHVKDSEPPIIDCPGDIYVMTSFNSNEGKLRWSTPDVTDNSGEQYENDLKLEQIGGPNVGEIAKIGKYVIKYKATDYFGNEGFCTFNVIVADRQAPKIIGCPKDSMIDVYADNEFTAYPEWEMPRASDNIDGSVDVIQLTGPKSGNKLTIPPGKTEQSYVIMYEATDSSDNGARCQFTITLRKGDESNRNENDMTGDDSNKDIPDVDGLFGKHHKLFRDRLSTRMPIGQDTAEIESHSDADNGYDLEGGNNNEDKQSDKWTEKARRLREERERKKEEKRNRRERRRNRRRGGHRSDIHEQNVNNNDNENDIIDEIRNEIETNEELNDVADSSSNGNGDDNDNDNGDDDDDSEGGSRRGRRNRKRKRDRKNKGKAWQTIKNFFWSLFRPWTWPIWLIIPLLILCTSGCCVGIYFLYEDISKPKGLRVPRKNASIWYKISNHPWFGGKTQKHRI